MVTISCKCLIKHSHLTKLNRCKPTITISAKHTRNGIKTLTRMTMREVIQIQIRVLKRVLNPVLVTNLMILIKRGRRKRRKRRRKRRRKKKKKRNIRKAKMTENSWRLTAHGLINLSY